MRRIWPLLSALLVVHSPTIAQTVPEGVHTDASGPSNVCGISGEDALAIRARLKSDSTIVEKPSG